MRAYCVIYLGSLIGIYTSPVDAAAVARALEKSVVVSCVLNSETETGKSLLQPPA